GIGSVPTGELVIERPVSARFTAGKVCFGSNVTARICSSALSRPRSGPRRLAALATAQVRAVLRYCGVGVGVGVVVGVGVGVFVGVSGGVGVPPNQPNAHAITSNITITPTTPYQRRLSLKSIGPPPDAEHMRAPAHKGIRDTETPLVAGQEDKGG